MVLDTSCKWVIGLACDRGYVEHTAVTLASIDINGEVPDAEVIVAAFDITAADRAILRAGAGRLAKRMRIVDVTSAMLQGLMGTDWTPDYPIALLGRFIIPGSIAVKGARLILVDSDMIVNVSLRPLFELRMYESFLAACHDVPRKDDMNYFNAGLMVIDVDRFKAHEIAPRSLRWLAECEATPRWIDQDALNLIVGHIWHRLDHRWNFHCNYEKPRPVIAADYDEAFIAHFAATKPWNDSSHPGRPLYEYYRDQLKLRLTISEGVENHADPAFIATAANILLGREPIDEAEYFSYSLLTASQIIERLVNSPEFVTDALMPLVFNQPFRTDRFHGKPTARHRLWAIDRLSLQTRTIDQLGKVESWREMLACLVADPDFRRKTSSVPLMTLTDGVEQWLRGDALMKAA